MNPNDKKDCQQALEGELLLTVEGEMRGHSVTVCNDIHNKGLNVHVGAVTSFVIRFMMMLYRHCKIRIYPKRIYCQGHNALLYSFWYLLFLYPY